MELNQDSYIKLDGAEVSRDALYCIKVLSAENERLLAVAQAEQELELARRKQNIKDRKATANQYVKSGQARIDLDEVLEPYYEDVVVRAGWWLWPRITKRKLDHTKMIRENSLIKYKLHEKCFAFWGELTCDWYMSSEPSTIITRIEIRFERDLYRKVENLRGNTHYPKLHLIDDMHRLTKLSGEVYLTLADHNKLIGLVADANDVLHASSR